MIENMEVEALVELLAGLTSPEASLLADKVISNITRRIQHHDEANIDIIEPITLQEYVQSPSAFLFSVCFSRDNEYR